MVGNMLPADGSMNLSLPLSLSWSPATNTSQYDVYIWPVGNPQPGSPTYANLSQINLTIYSGLSYGTDYNWRIVAKNSCFQTSGPIQTFGLRELPDLVVQNVMPPPAAFSGQPVSISWQVLNQGLGNTGSSQWSDNVYLSLDTIYQSGTDLLLGGAGNVSFLNNGQSYQQTAVFTLPQGISGDYYVIVRTDHYNSVLETNNNNNQARSAGLMVVNLTPPPDLQVSAMITPNNVFSGQTVGITWTVTNQGTGGSQTGNWFDRVYLSTDPAGPTNPAVLGTFSHAGLLDPDSSYTAANNVVIPQGIFGTYYIYVTTDIYDNVFESALENNNTLRSNPITVILTPPPDLLVTSMTVPDTVSNKESVQISWTVQNQGGSATLTGSWSDRIYLSHLPSFDVDSAIILGTASHSGVLGVGGMYTNQKGVIIPANINGPYYFYITVDVGNSVDEFANEANNTQRATDATEVQSPDLLVSGIMAPDTVNSGQMIAVNWAVKNAGPGNLVSGSWNDRVMISPDPVYNPGSIVQLGLFPMSNSIQAGDSLIRLKNVSIPNGLSGTYYFYFHTDNQNQVFEHVNEGNNISRSDPVYIKLTPWPDLIVSSVATVDTSTAGNTIPLSFTVLNDGLAAATGNSWKDRVYISPDPVWNPANGIQLLQFPSSGFLQVDSSYTVATSALLPASLSAGIWYLYVITDVEDKIYEHTDENNNITRSDSLFLYGYPPVDLSVSLFSAPDSANSGTAVAVQATVMNIGMATTLAGSWVDAVYLSTDMNLDTGVDPKLGEWTHSSPVNPGGSYMLNKSVTIPSGTSGDFYLLFITDRDDANNDVDLVNNLSPSALHVSLTPPPDLQVTAFSAPQAGTAGQPVVVHWTVQNNGAGPTLNGSWKEKVYLSTDFVINSGDIFLGSRTHNGNLNPTQQYSDSLQVFLPNNQSGNRILIIQADGDNVVYEHTNEGNNTANTLITLVIPPPADLVVTGILAPPVANAGSSISIDWTVQNIGLNPASGYMREAVYFSSDTVWDIGDVLFGTKNSTINLAPMATSNRNLTGLLPGLPLGDYFVIVNVDILNNIVESNDNNNVSASDDPVTITVPELPLNVLTPDILTNQQPLYYRIEIPDSLENESLLVTLTGDSLNGANEFYIRFGNIPTRVVYDYSHENPFEGIQEVVVPTLQEGTYYIMGLGSTTAGSFQPVTLLARILNFEIRKVQANKGGNTGPVTVKITGSKFTSSMGLRLVRNNISIPATQITYVDPTTVFATFNLLGRPLGFYDVVAEKPGGELAKLKNGFEVISGLPPDLQVNVRYPSSTRPGNIFSMKVEFINAGNTDIPSPFLTLQSHGGSPIAFQILDLINGDTELGLTLTEANGPPGVLRPGAGGIVVVYSRALTGLSYGLLIPDLE
jgi:subtilase family serine protease